MSNKQAFVKDWQKEHKKLKMQRTIIQMLERKDRDAETENVPAKVNKTAQCHYFP